MTGDGATMLTYVSGDVSYCGLLLESSRERPAAVVVLLPDWRGQSVLAREHADVLVSAGCTVLVADLYGNGWNPTDPDEVGQDEVSPVGNDARFELYTQTHHGFDNPDAGTDPTARLVHSPASAARARTAITRFVSDVSDAG